MSSLRTLQTKEAQHVYSISHNIIECKQVEEQLKKANNLLRRLSSEDGLTGIWNHRTFHGNHGKT